MAPLPSSMLLLLIHLLLIVVDVAAAPGSWQLLVQNAGISAMHAAVTHHNTVVLLDRTNIGASQIALPPGVCRNNPLDRRLKHDCTAHSVVLDLNNNGIRPLLIQTDTWCSSGQFVGDGTLVQTGGDADGITKIRLLPACPGGGSCNWMESSRMRLQEPRWYATNQLLPDGRQIVVGGRGVFTLEFVPPRGQPPVPLQLLRDSSDPQADNLYPFVHLLPNGNLFIFANADSIEYDYNSNSVLRHYPRLPGGPRNYPSAGSSAMLSLLPQAPAGEYSKAEILICGGAQYGAYQRGDPTAPATQTCGRIVATDGDAAWEMETMPLRRTMGDMVLAPTGQVVIINGAQTGSQGWGNAAKPALNPVLYSPNNPPGARFTIQAASPIPRMYHSTANLLPDGRILIAGSNTHETYTFQGPFPTELRIEAFSPGYLHGPRPDIRATASSVAYGTEFRVTVASPSAGLELALLSAPFATHSFSMGQRSVKLAVVSSVAAGPGLWELAAQAPPSASVAPSGYYMLFAVSRPEGVPSRAAWVHVA